MFRSRKHPLIPFDMQGASWRAGGGVRAWLPGLFVGPWGVVFLWLLMGIFFIPGVSLAQPPVDPGARAQVVPGGQAPMTDIHDIKPLVAVDVPGTIPLAWWYALGGLVLAGLLVAAAWRYWRRRRGPRNVEPAEILLPPEMVAYDALDKLAGDKTLAPKMFYFRLSAILRVYLSGRFSVDGLEMTTEELLPAVERLAIDRALKSGIKDFLLYSDPVKFAGIPASPTRMGQDLEFVRGLVKQTTPELTNDENTGPNEEPIAPRVSGADAA